MKRKHREEMLRWAESDDGVFVWKKSPRENNWTITNAPGWFPYDNYVVDDEWAHLRKALKDGKTLQFNKAYIGSYKCEPHWVDWNSHGEAFTGSPGKYRIKPEPKYEWQWLCMRSNGEYYCTGYLKSEEVVYKVINPHAIVGKIEESKREVRDECD